MMPAGRWSTEELERRALLEQGIAGAVNLRRHGNLIAWARERRPFVRVDRATPWGNPFELGKDGDRETVIANYRDHYLPFKPSLLRRRRAEHQRAAPPAARRQPPKAGLSRKTGWSLGSGICSNSLATKPP